MEEELKPKQADFNAEMLTGYIPLLKQMRSVKQPLDAAPTFTPQNLLDQIQLYENGSTRRIYYYVNGTWRYSTLT